MQCIQHVILLILMYVLNQKVKFIHFSISDISEINLRFQNTKNSRYTLK